MRWLKGVKMKLVLKLIMVFLLISVIFISVFAYLKHKSAVDKQNAKLINPVIIGFAQLGSESAWRNANSESIKQAAKDAGVDLIFKNAEGDLQLQKQIIQEFIIQQVDIIVFPPLVSEGWDDILTDAKEAKIPVILLDRLVKTNKPNLFDVSIGSDFFSEGEKVAQWLVDNVDTTKQVNIIELQGLPGSSPTTGRAKGFRQVIEKYPNIKFLDSTPGDFIRAKGNIVMAGMLKKYGKNINVVFAHNDDMALGAIDAIEAYGLKPGKDILILSVDGEKAILQAIKDHKANVSAECTPLLGPVLIQTINDLLAGKKVPKRIVSKEKVFTIENVDKEISSRTY